MTPPTPDLVHDDAMTLADVASRFDRKEDTVSTWVNVGLRGVKLPTMLVGRTPYTTMRCVQWFLEESTRRARTAGGAS